jgi:hypothetical protein
MINQLLRNDNDSSNSKYCPLALASTYTQNIPMDLKTTLSPKNLKRKASRLIASVKFWVFVGVCLAISGEFGFAVLACGAAVGLLFGRISDGPSKPPNNDWQDENGFRSGPFGYGQYVGNMRVDDEEDDL